MSAFAVKPFKVAAILTNWTAGTELAVAGKLALVAPPGTVTLAGTVTGVGAVENVLVESATTAPPAGAGAYSVTITVAEVPETKTPIAWAGSHLSDNTVRTGLTCSPAVPVVPVPG